MKPLDYINDLLLLTYILPDLAAQWFINTCHGLVDHLEEAPMTPGLVTGAEVMWA